MISLKHKYREETQEAYLWTCRLFFFISFFRQKIEIASRTKERAQSSYTQDNVNCSLGLWEHTSRIVSSTKTSKLMGQYSLLLLMAQLQNKKKKKKKKNKKKKWISSSRRLWWLQTVIRLCSPRNRIPITSPVETIHASNIINSSYSSSSSEVLQTIHTISMARESDVSRAK